MLQGVDGLARDRTRRNISPVFRQTQKMDSVVPLSLDTTTDASVQEATADLTRAYAGQATKVMRKVSIIHCGTGNDGGDDVVVRDRITSESLSAISTGFVTDAGTAFNIYNHKVLELYKTSEDGTQKSYSVALLSPDNAYFTVTPIEPRTPETARTMPRGGQPTRVEVNLPGPATNADVTYEFTQEVGTGRNAPGDVQNLSALTSECTSTSVRLRWTAPCAVYDIRYSESPIDDFNWPAATRCSGDMPTSVCGEAEAQTYVAASLNPNTKYYFAVRSRDNDHNWSWVSNCVSDPRP